MRLFNLWRCRPMQPEHEIAELYADVARLERENKKLSEMAIYDRAEIAELKKRLDEASAENKSLAEQLDTAEYMRKVLSKRLANAEQRANGYGKYTVGAV